MAREMNRTEDGDLACAFGWPWLLHGLGPLFECPFCRAECERLSAEFWADVARGIYDSEGYTPAERRAKERRRHEEPDHPANAHRAHRARHAGEQPPG